MDGTTLSNRHGITLNGTWYIPDTGETETIKNNATGKYLSTDDYNEAGSAVVEVSFDPNDDGGKWERSANDDSGYFTLKNPKSGRFLYAQTPDRLTIEGTASGL